MGRARPAAAVICSADQWTRRGDRATRRLDLSDAALLAAFVLIAVLGTLQKCLLVNDGAVYLAAAWLGNAWDLFYSQNTGRARFDPVAVRTGLALATGVRRRRRRLHRRRPRALLRSSTGAVADPARRRAAADILAPLPRDRPGADPVHVGDGAGHRALDDLARPGGRPGAIAPRESRRQRRHGRDPRPHPSRHCAAEPGFRRLRRCADPSAPAFLPRPRDRGPGDGRVPDGRVLRDRGDVGADQSDDRRAARRGEVRLHRSALDVRHARPFSRCWRFFGC